jgi:L-2-hydroxyglutarate oxidase LhgO
MKEPSLSHDIIGAVHVPGEVIVDSWLVPASYLHDALCSGRVTLLTNAAVHAVKQVSAVCAVDAAAATDTGTGTVTTTGSITLPPLWHVASSQGVLPCRVVINCAGMHLSISTSMIACMVYHADDAGLCD